MINLAKVQQILTEEQRLDLVGHAPLLMQIANIYINDDELFQEFIDVPLRETAGDLNNLPPGHCLVSSGTSSSAAARILGCSTIRISAVPRQWH